MSTSTSESGSLTASAARRAQARINVEELDAAITSVFGCAEPKRPTRAVTTTRTARAHMVVDRYDKETLPAYSTSPEPPQPSEPLPKYEEPLTLARRLFFYGFVFFPFWFIGLCLLLCKPRSPDWAATDVTPDDHVKYLEILNQTEVKWARRCGYAILVAGVVVACVVCLFKYSIMRFP